MATATATELAHRGPRRRRPGRPALKHLVLGFFVLLMIYPLLWMVASSFKPGELVLSEPGLIPSDVTFENYRDGWNALNYPFSRFFLNSLFVSVGAILGNLFSCSLAAYALARLEFRARRLYFAITLASVMLPLHVLVVPQYIVFSELGMVNTYFPLLLPKFLATDAFFTFLMVQFIRTLPRELDQAAAIDGAGPFRTFWSIILPLLKPALITTTIFTFIWTWNDFFTPLIYLTSTEMFTAPVALKSLVDSQTQQGIGILFAMSLLSLIPILVFFVVAQKYLIRGIATTGIK
ncbi:carbohydrate ABC transporter permease [Georgenia halophila]|uniref:Carbohydrate ABC transporter permease n=1 Tax=Georgenia halophila TaxID=620889 RepID=A0ABP8LNX2_9MICO